MPINAYADQGALEIAVGGANRLLQLADFNGTGNINDAGVQAVITNFLESGAAELRTAVEVKHDPETIANLDTPSLRRLSDANASLSARIAFEKGTGGQAMPPNVEAAAARADKFADDLAVGTRRLGRVSGGRQAALSQPVGVVDYDTGATGVSIAGFKNGFR